MIGTRIWTGCLWGLALLAAGWPATAQTGDPTRPTAKMADRLKVRALDAHTVKLRALVVGTGAHGVAAFESAGQIKSVRVGSQIVETVDGVPLTLKIRAITPVGVEIETADGAAPLFVPGSFQALAAPTNPPPEFIRYLEASQMPLEYLLRLVSDQTGVNISASEKTAQKTVSVFLRNVTAVTAVEEICRTTGLWFRRETGSDVLRVTTMEEYAENLSSFREEKTESFVLLYPNAIEVASVIYGLYPERTMLSLGEEEFDEDAENDLSRRFRRFQVLADNGGSSFMRMEAPDANTSSGGRSGSGIFSYSRGGGIQRMGNQWDWLRKSARLQGLTQGEAKKIDQAFTRADTNLYEQVYGRAAPQSANIFVTLSRKANMLFVRTSDAGAMDAIRDLIKRIDVPTPMVLLEVKVLELTVTDDYDATFQWSFNRASHTVGHNGAEARDNILSGFPGFDSVTGADPTLAGALSFQVVGDNVAARIQLLQKDGKVKTLATPTILTANNEVSRIFDGHEHPVIKGISGQTVIGENQTVSSPATEFEYEDVGTMLLITPSINADRTVTLHVLQENSELTENGAEIPVYSSTSLNAVSSAHVDTIHSRSLSGTFVAKDGMTVMAGGLISEKEKEVYTRTPFLGSMPLLGWMFRGTEKVKERSELIILIKPHVIATPMEGGKASRELLEALSAHPAADGRESMGIHKPLKEHTSRDDIKSIVK